MRTCAGAGAGGSHTYGSTKLGSWSASSCTPDAVPPPSLHSAMAPAHHCASKVLVRPVPRPDEPTPRRVSGSLNEAVGERASWCGCLPLEPACVPRARSSPSQSLISFNERYAFAPSGSTAFVSTTPGAAWQGSLNPSWRAGLPKRPCAKQLPGTRRRQQRWGRARASWVPLRSPDSRSILAPSMVEPADGPPMLSASQAGLGCGGPQRA